MYSKTFLDRTQIFFVHRPEIYGLFEDAEGNLTRGPVELIIAQNSSGKLGEIQLKLNKISSPLSEVSSPLTEFNSHVIANNPFDNKQNEAPFGFDDASRVE
ncbi:MAG: hypothetical protein U9N85_08135, partial [Bacteroidota bacterium]|nr:hypothetical protein [Bacteroidota bacterium]